MIYYEKNQQWPEISKDKDSTDSYTCFQRIDHLKGTAVSLTQFVCNRIFNHQASIRREAPVAEFG
jgi:hypothetical protein